MKYDTLRQLKDAYDGGQLGRDVPLMLDNDSADVYDEASNEDVFEMHPYDLLRQALDLLGIPHDQA